MSVVLLFFLNRFFKMVQNKQVIVCILKALNLLLPDFSLAEGYLFTWKGMHRLSLSAFRFPRFPPCKQCSELVYKSINLFFFIVE